MYVWNINNVVSNFFTEQSENLKKSLDAVIQVEGFNPTMILVFFFIVLILVAIVVLKILGYIG